MKKLLLALIVVAIVFLIVSFFVPAKLTYQLSVASTQQNILTALQPKSWTKWESSVQKAWQKDSTSCHFGPDIDIPGKKIHITQVSPLLFVLEQTAHNHSDELGLMIVPNVPDPLHTSLVYSRVTNLFYKLFSFLEKPSFSITAVPELRTYLEDVPRFYGFPIQIRAVKDSLFVTKSANIPANELFTTLAATHKELEDYARQNSCKILNKNISFLPLDHDSLTVMVGLNIDKVITGDYSYNFKQLPSGLILATGRFEGRFSDRMAIYLAMQNYLKDHLLIKRAFPYETYRSSFPASDTSNIQMDLSYPVTPQ